MKLVQEAMERLPHLRGYKAQAVGPAIVIFEPHHAQYVPVMRFEPYDGEYAATRMTYRGRGGWSWEACVTHVPKLGAPMLDVAFDFLQAHPEHELSLAYLVSRFAEDDPRVLALLTRLVEIAPVNVACILGTNRHRSWIPVLVRCLENLKPAPEDVGPGLEAAEWQAAWNREEPHCYSRLRLGEQRPGGWVEVVPSDRHPLSN